MPVSLIPLILPALLVGLLCYGATRGRRALIAASLLTIATILAVALPFYVPGWILMFRASRDNGSALYDLARWHENHCEKIGRLVLWPWSPDVETGYSTLERSAATGYAPAIYALGVRLKYGQFVPRPTGWTGAGGNVFPQPERGQALIDKAIGLGYRRTGDDSDFYWSVFRKD